MEWHCDHCGGNLRQCRCDRARGDHQRDSGDEGPHRYARNIAAIFFDSEPEGCMADFPDGENEPPREGAKAPDLPERETR